MTVRLRRLPTGVRDPRYTEENILLDRVLGQCKLLHLFALHIRPGRTLDGWRTPIAGNGKGFPDLFIVGGRGILRELKSSAGRLTREQAEWRDRLLAAGLDWAIWRPADWESGRIHVELHDLARKPVRGVAMSLYLTKTRRQLLEDIAAGLVSRDAKGDLWLNVDGRKWKVTSRVGELALAGWVTHVDGRVQLTARGEQVLADASEATDG